MRVGGVKITWVSADEAPEQRERPGFTDVCQYGSLKPERNEIGSITVADGPKAYTPTGIFGLWVIGGLRCIERIFIVEPEHG